LIAASGFFVLMKALARSEKVLQRTNRPQTVAGLLAQQTRHGQKELNGG
jgi:hypothetical protein